VGRQATPICFYYFQKAALTEPGSIRRFRHWQLTTDTDTHFGFSIAAIVASTRSLAFW
jgi:hypothetical protein